ncbi:MAG TPA: ATP-dependent sacrificial sulfur transferase LarE [Bacteroidales bacterium]|nr:ATP-dependent sacrificial sulfur transferase LarE [Bacteroidales bacterium]
MTDSKLQKLNRILKELDSAVVAFSGGVDSSFLLYMAHKANKRGIVAVTIKTPYIPSREIEEATEFTKIHGIKHQILNLSFPEIIRHNPVERCYLCKKTLFNQIIDFARTNKYESILDGSNSDDRGEFRPGMKALKEMGIRSPLLESGITKSEIREQLRKEGLNIWDKPAMACLLTRIPYNTEIKTELLKMIEEAENILFEIGYPGTRVRVHEDIARIECLPGYLEKIIQNPEREQIVAQLKKIGFRYISLDLEGYRTGSLNPEN